MHILYLLTNYIDWTTSVLSLAMSVDHKWKQKTVL